MSSDAITLLKRDHQEVKKLFREFKKREGEDRSDLAIQIIGELTAHTYIENEVMYPAVRGLVPDLDDDILESYEEHHVVDILMSEILALEPSDERWAAKMTVLMELVEHHVTEEEDEWFPVVRENLSRTQLSEIGAQMQELRASAPRRPERARSSQSAGSSGRGRK